MLFAFCWASGEVGFGSSVPEGAITLAQGRNRIVRQNIMATSRMAYDGKTLLVPGIPEAESYDDAEKALAKHIGWLKQREKPGFHVVGGHI